MKLDQAVTIADLRTMARRRLPKMVFDALDGGSGDEMTLRSNRRSFEKITFRPKPFVDVSRRDLRTTVFGEKIGMPLMLAPTGSARMASAEAELLLARVAGKFDTIYAHSTVASYSAKDTAAAASGPLWFQLYLPPDQAALRRLLDEVAESGYRALVLTIDTPLRGNRDRDARNKFSLPYQVTPTLIAQGLSRPRWSAQFVLENIKPQRSAGTSAKRLSLRQVESTILSSSYPVTRKDLQVVRDVWDGPLIVKGVLRADACDQLVDEGVDGIIVSNHGGRQLDGTPATIDVLSEIVDAVDGRMPVFMDGGIRRGTDIVKAVATGATACFIGRSYVYGLAAAGQVGLEKALNILRQEIDHTLALLGCSSISELDRSFIRAENCR